MRLDAAQLAAEAEAKEARMRSAAWTDTGHHDENWVASLTQGDVLDPEPMAIAAPAVSARRTRASSRPAVAAERREPLHEDLAPTPAAPVDLGEITAQLDAMGRTLQALSEGMARLRAERPVAAEGVPTWLQHAAGDPLTYDAPDPSRMTVCVRVLPARYAQLQQVQTRLGLRTAAGAWEYLLRLGVAAALRVLPR
jgi:hypothetical protein